MRKLIFALLVMTASGCATEAVLPSKAEPAPSDRVFLYQQKTEQTDSTLIVVRDSGYLGSGCFTGVYINGKRAASLEPSEKAVFYLQSGEVSLGMKGEGKLCLSDAVPSMRDFNLAPNSVKAVRLFADPGGNVDIKPLPNE